VVVAVAPMVLCGLPYDLIQWLTRPAPVDAVLVRLTRPPVAIITVTVLLVGSMTPVMVRAQSTSPVARGLIDAAILLAGLVLWVPVLGRIPGILRPKPVVRFGYLVIQAVVPAFLSFVYIFSRRPLYGEFARSHAAIGLRPLNDQQIAGFVSKLTMLFVLLTVGAVVLARAPRSEDEFGTDEPLVWADVEREFERVERQGTKDRETGGVLDPTSGPRPGPGSGPRLDTEDTPTSGPSPEDGLSERSNGAAEPPEGEQPDQ
jgi:cytochrome c oxidase assembly factor CtaG